MGEATLTPPAAVEQPSKASAGSSCTMAEPAFLPKTMLGKLVLVHVGGNTWRVDNSVLQYAGPELGYRRSKRLDDRLDAGKKWGSLVDGIDTGDGWLQTQVNMAQFH